MGKATDGGRGVDASGGSKSLPKDPYRVSENPKGKGFAADRGVAPEVHTCSLAYSFKPSRLIAYY